VPNVEYTGNSIKTQKQMAKKKSGRPDSDYKNQFFENVLNMDDEEDENFEEAATKRVEEAISSILAEEEDQGIAPFTPADQMSVYYQYTKEGAVREDPEEAKKKAKATRMNKERVAKRPLTARKKKADMMKGDLVGMVESMQIGQKKKQKKKVQIIDCIPESEGTHLIAT